MVAVGGQAGSGLPDHDHSASGSGGSVLKGVTFKANASDQSILFADSGGSVRGSWNTLSTDPTLRLTSGGGSRIQDWGSDRLSRLEGRWWVVAFAVG